MCLPPDVIPALHCTGKATVINGPQWAVDQRPFIWATASKSAEKAPSGPFWTAWTDTFYPRAPLPYAGIQTKAGGSDKLLEADSSLSLGSLQTSATTPLPNEFEILQSKVWEPQPNGREAAGMRSFFCSPSSGAASGVDTLQQSLSREGSVVSFTSSPRISIPVVRESLQSIKVPYPIDSWEGSMSEEEKFRRSSWVDELIEEDRMQNASALKRKLRSGSACTGKASTITHLKAGHCNNRPAVSTKEISPRSKDVSMSESLSDNEDVFDDEGEGGPGVSEKRRKRMLSNRASAQRSRQRRQERLDTLEVLVAELRVENAALSRRANSAVTVAKKFEEENKILRDRFGKQEPVHLSDSKDSNESDKTTENSDVAAYNKNGATWRTEIGPTEYSHYSNYSRESSQHLKRDGDHPVENSRPWNNNVSSSSFDFDFNSDVTDSATATYRETLSRTPLSDNLGAVNVKDLYQHKIMSLAQNRSFQGLDPFGIELEQCNQETDKKNLDSRSAEDMWLESLANCLK